MGKLDWNSSTEVIEMCIEVQLDGPVDSAEVHYDDDRHGVRRPGEFALECAAL